MAHAAGRRYFHGGARHAGDDAAPQGAVLHAALFPGPVRHLSRRPDRRAVSALVLQPRNRSGDRRGAGGPAVGQGQAGCHRHSRPCLGARLPEAAGRPVHQGREDDHRAGGVPHHRDRHRRHARSRQAGPRRVQGVRLLPVLLDAGADRRPDGRQHLPARRGHEHRPGVARSRGSGKSARLREPVTRPDRDGLHQRHHPDHLRRRLHRREHPAGAVPRHRVRHLARLDRRSRQAGGGCADVDQHGRLQDGGDPDAGGARSGPSARLPSSSPTRVCR